MASSSFPDEYIEQAVEVYCRTLDEDRGGTGAYLYIGSENAMRAALDFLHGKRIESEDSGMSDPQGRDGWYQRFLLFMCWIGLHDERPPLDLHIAPGGNVGRICPRCKRGYCV